MARDDAARNGRLGEPRRVFIAFSYLFDSFLSPGVTSLHAFSQNLVVPYVARDDPNRDSELGALRRRVDELEATLKAKEEEIARLKASK